MKITGTIKILLGILLLVGTQKILATETVVWSDNFDSGIPDDRWYADQGAWQFGSPTVGPSTNVFGYRTFSGATCATTGLNTNYPPDQDSRLIRIASFIVPPSNGFPRLRFWQWFSIGGGDHAMVEIKPQGSNTWISISPDYGDVGNIDAVRTGGGVWTRPSLDLSFYAGLSVQVAFHFVSDGGSSPAPNGGWFVDDITLVTNTPVLPNPEGFELGLGDWSTEKGTWQVGAPTSGRGTAYAGTNCAVTRLGTNYDANVDSRFVSPSFTVSAANLKPRLRFWQWYSIGGGDHATVEIKPQGSNTWTSISPDYGDVGNIDAVRTGGGVWTRPSLDLSFYAGLSVQVAFHFTSDGGSSPAPNGGWFVDDITLVTNIPVSPNPEGFELGLGDWSAEKGTWQVGAPTSGPGAAYAGTNCAATRLGTNYDANVDSRLISAVFTVPPAIAAPALRYRHWFRFAGGDQGKVEIRKTSTNTWTTLATYSGVSGIWTYPFLDLSTFGGQTVQLAFHFTSDNTAGQDNGWYIDDVFVRSDVLSPLQDTTLNSAAFWSYAPAIIGSGYAFTLSNAPAGMTVDTNGVITWSPNESQGPFVYPNITLSVTQPGNALSPITSQSFRLTADFGTNTPGTVAITYPPDNAVFTAPVDLPIAVSSTISNNPISQVTFFAGAQTIGTVTTPPFTFVWTNAPIGTNDIHVLATVLYGGSSITVSSAPVKVGVSLAPPGQPVFTLSSSAYAVPKNGSSVVVTVLKSANSVAGAVNYTTVNGSALAFSGGIGNYQALSGSLSFTNGEISKTVSIPIVNNSFYTGNRDFTFALSRSGTNGDLANPSSATVTIVEVNPPASTNSFLSPVFPAAVPPHDGQLRVSIQPANSGGQWRLAWETAWRNSDDTISGLPSGNYEVEFKAVAGFVQPGNTTNPVVAGQMNWVTNQYLLNGSPQYGSLAVTLLPASLASQVNVSLRAQWRLQGDSTWRDSDYRYTGLIAGNHIVEFKSLTDWTAPKPRVIVIPGNQDTTVSASYLIADTSSGSPPGVLQFSDASSPAFGLPYVYNGQLLSDVGYGSGFVVKQRVVLTAAHVVFNDATLSYVPNVRWFFQRHLGTYEPPAQVPRGWYAFSGYAAARTNDNSPGISSPTSQNLDVAALYFAEDAGRGGYSGYLVSEPGGTEWLQASALKTLVGYPVETVSDTDRGRMHATTPGNISFTLVTNRVFSTTAIRGYPGMSGGPLCVQFTNGAYYPAAVYFGGSAQTIVRAIDGAVADLINRAEVTSYTGNNSTGGGVVQLTSGTGALFAPGYFHVILTPSNAVSAGAAWTILQVTNNIYFSDNAATYALPAATYTLSFHSAPGFLTPPDRPLLVAANQTATLFVNYSNFSIIGSLPTFSNGLPQLAFAAAVGQKYALERSTNLIDWIPLVTNTAGNDGFVRFIDSNAATRNAFYRVRLAP
jgi:hypothetical protein